MSKPRAASIAYVRADHHDVTPAIARAREAGTSLFSNVTIICWNRAGESLPGREMDGTATIHRFRTTAPPRSFRIVLTTFVFQAWVLKMLLRTRPDVVHVCDFYSCVPASAFSLLWRKKLVYDMRDAIAHCFNLTFGARQLISLLDWLLMATCTGFVVPAACRLRYLGRWGRPPRHVIVVPNTCHDEVGRRTHPVADHDNDDATRIAVLGYLHAMRGVHELVELCRNEQAGVQLVVAGHCRDESLKKKLKGSPNVRFFDRVPRDEALDLMAAADMVSLMYDPALPANRLGAPNKFYEAMMVGTPVICSRRMIISATVRSHELGFALDYGDIPQLEHAAAQLRDPTTRDRLRTNCRRFFESQSPLADVIVEYRRWYERIVCD